MAHAANGVIGNKGGIPWHGKMREDMRRFKERTSGHAVIMGRLTMNSLKGPLPNRLNVVVSRTATTRVPGFAVVPTLEAAYEVAAREEETFVIGGARLYSEASSTVDCMYITKIQAEVEGDTYFEVDTENGNWKLTDRDLWASGDDNIYPCMFETYKRLENA